jgi:hypothetical protein
MKQSSIEWLKEHLTVSFNDDIILLLHFFEQAKAMHKEEHRKTFNQGLMSNFQNFDDYYNETFNTKEE